MMAEANTSLVLIKTEPTPEPVGNIKSEPTVAARSVLDDQLKRVDDDGSKDEGNDVGNKDWGDKDSDVMQKQPAKVNRRMLATKAVRASSLHRTKREDNDTDDVLQPPTKKLRKFADIKDVREEQQDKDEDDGDNDRSDYDNLFYCPSD